MKKNLKDFLRIYDVRFCFNRRLYGGNKVAFFNEFEGNPSNPLLKLQYLDDFKDKLRDPFS